MRAHGVELLRSLDEHHGGVLDVRVIRAARCPGRDADIEQRDPQRVIEDAEHAPVSDLDIEVARVLGEGLDREPFLAQRDDAHRHEDRARGVVEEPVNALLEADRLEHLRANLDAEAQQLLSEIGRISTQTEFNGATVFNGSTRSIQVGADAGQTITISAQAALTAIGGDITTAGAASAMVTSVDNMLDAVATRRANLGAAQSRLSSTVANLQNASEALSASRSRIQDADFASETAQLTRSQILQQAGTAMLAQANSSPQSVLSLLG